MVADLKTQVEGMPLKAQVRFMRQAWETELRMRQYHLTGENKRKKCEQAEICISICDRLLLPTITGA